VDEYSVVRVVRLSSLDRPYDGTDKVRREPRVGDIGTIAHVYSPKKAFIVECIDSEGLTLWVPDFVVEELELLSR
jgi:hypothetical protein